MENGLIEVSNIENLIYEVRGVQVMLDSDIAMLYHVETKRINEFVSRNKERFPEKYCFRISEYEYNSLKSQIATSKGGSRKGHRVFAEQGVYMLATILKSDVAIKVSMDINPVEDGIGYEIYRSTNKRYWTKIKTLTDLENLTYINNTKKGTTYYYKVRTYSLVNGKKVYSGYSTITSI